MAFTDFDAYLAALSANQGADFQSGAIASRNALRYSALSLLPTPATPTSSVACDKTSDRAINTFIADGGSGRLSVLGGRFNPSGTSGVMLMLVDILNISGGMSGIVTGSQTTGLPTAALTRYTDGVGVHAAIIGHVSIGATVTTVRATYTNQSGTGSRITTATEIGANYRDPGFLIRLPLQAGDTGMRSVEDINIVATTGTAGNIGIVMYKPLAMFFANDVERANIIDCVSTGRMVGQFNEVLDNACLSLFAVTPSAQAVSGAIILGEA